MFLPGYGSGFQISLDPVSKQIVLEKLFIRRKLKNYDPGPLFFLDPGHDPVSQDNKIQLYTGGKGTLKYFYTKLV